ncbi:MBL fold metallo-hydrolase [Paracrocinitomix mangrovi]|uniref:MBL fold metallo-hydrolase n=1 Tax=Paracrocinitomix mangrovi TaxID=2862509 RepID=UPI001C8DBF77|nr:MBL fold metallo-hydrolase [Paracrocinitomix mangrovi]UKN01873.1 MBL fold metallo-hydrolase [Paracrocinitomix mangrovi]
MIKVHKLTFNPFQENTYILSDETNECVIIDPGCYDRSEQVYLKSYIEENGLKPVKLLNTHCHIDHVLGNYFVSKEWDLELGMHEADLVTLHNIPNYAELYGFGGYQISPDPTYYINEGDKVTFGNSTLEVLFGPGHAPGHIAFYSLEDDFIINGDILFQGSFGRTDLPGGNFQILKDTIVNKMFNLPESMTVFTGHGPETKIGYEKMTNPILHMNL